MAIEFEVLGQAGRDNALLVRIDTGQRIHRLLFDCGDQCLSSLSFSEIQSIDDLFFSHFHMDHVGGFDNFFRCNFNRTTIPNRIWGPAGASTILHHRFRGYLWNLVSGQQAHWNVFEVSPKRCEQFRFELAEAFEHKHEDGVRELADSIIFDNQDFTISAFPLKHHGVSLGYVIQEKPKFNIDKLLLAQSGLPPGPWMQKLKDSNANGQIEIAGQEHELPQLRETLMIESSGASIAYLTDFLLDLETREQLKQHLQGINTVVCEAQYAHQDLVLAERNHHTTVQQVADLANSAEVGELLLFHLSDRYTRSQWQEMLQHSQAIFESTRFPPHWQLD